MALKYFALRLFVGLAGLATALQIAALATDAPNDLLSVCTRIVAIMLLLLAAWLGSQLGRRVSARVIVTALLAIWLLYMVWPLTSLAWFLVVLGVLGVTTLTVGRGRLFYWVTAIGGAFLLAALVVSSSEVKSLFADEEFYAAAQAAVLAVVFFVCVVVTKPRSAREVRGAQPIQVMIVAVALIAGGAAWGYVVLRAYQASFNSENVPAYSGISAANPSVCANLPPNVTSGNGSATFDQLLSLAAANPRKGTADLGMLALARHDANAAVAFRQALLTEARGGRFAGPAGSVKFGQYEAALRAHFYSRMRAVYPGLFSSEDARMIGQWFAAINRRAMTVEWVDLLYGAAFNMALSGPYENQENGVGLLSVLETSGLHDLALSGANRAYLDSHPRAWAVRFRNTDDSLSYQAYWLSNALWYADYAPQASRADTRRQAFEWMLEQALPDGSSVNYNPPTRAAAASTYYLGASLLHDSRFVWLTDVAIDYLRATGRYPAAQPFLEEPTGIASMRPSTGSCLIYGDSGLPSVAGPLAPDKVVLRGGWDAGALVLLLNLRFTGWHRYKATNTVIALDQGGSLVREAVEHESIGWLPQGRAVLRDKRILREQLNGLQVEAQGLPAVLSILGMASPWAQDPPAYAAVEHFEPVGPVQIARLKVADWHGWRHTRTVTFDPAGIVIVWDRATGGEGMSAVSWHVTGSGARNGDALQIRGGEQPAQMVLAGDAWSHASVKPEGDADTAGQNIVYYSPVSGQLELATVFLTGSWAAAQVQQNHDDLLITLGGDTRSFALDRP